MEQSYDTHKDTAYFHVSFRNVPPLHSLYFVASSNSLHSNAPITEFSSFSSPFRQQLIVSSDKSSACCLILKLSKSLDANLSNNGIELRFGQRLNPFGRICPLFDQLPVKSIEITVIAMEPQFKCNALFLFVLIGNSTLFLGLCLRMR